MRRVPDPFHSQPLSNRHHAVPRCRRISPKTHRFTQNSCQPQGATNAISRIPTHPGPKATIQLHITFAPTKAAAPAPFGKFGIGNPRLYPIHGAANIIFHIYAPYPTTRPPCAHSSLNSHGYRFLRDNAVTTTMHQAYTNTLPKPQSHSPRLHIHRVSSHLFTPVSLSQAGKLWTPSLSTYAGQHLPSPSTRENATELRSYTASTIQGAQRHSP